MYIHTHTHTYTYPRTHVRIERKEVKKEVLEKKNFFRFVLRPYYS